MVCDRQSAPSMTATNATNPPASNGSVAFPSRKLFDPWNSSATGHQRAENRLPGSTSWRQSRNLKLGQQFRSGLSGGARVADTVGAGSTDFGNDGRKENGGWVKGAPGLREKGQRSIAEALGARTVKKPDGSFGITQKNVQEEHTLDTVEGNYHDSIVAEEDAPPSAQPKQQPATAKQIFQGLCFYINGSTAPLVSDHKLKQLIAEHGGGLSIALGRRSVTHVIIGDTSRQGGCGGGLAGGKMQKEIQRVGGKGIKFVNAEWIVESVKAGRRLSEAQFATLKKGQRSVRGMFKETSTALDATRSGFK